MLARRFLSIFLIGTLCFNFVFAWPAKTSAQSGGIASATLECTGLKDAAMAALKSLNPINTTVPTDPVALVAKENCMDAIGYAIVRLLIKEVKESVLDWVNNGFEGSPAFLTDPEGFFGDIARREAEIVVREVTRTASEIQRNVIKKVVRDTVNQVKRKRSPKDPGQPKNPGDVNKPSQPGAGGNGNVATVGGVPVTGGPAPTGAFGNPLEPVATSDTVAQDIARGKCEAENDRKLREALEASRVDGTNNAFIKTPDQYQLANTERETSNSAQSNNNLTLVDCNTFQPKNRTEQEAIKEQFARDFKSGSWDGWYSLAMKPNNNPYGYELAVREEIATEQAEETERLKQELAQGNGFLAQKTCVERDLGGYTREEIEAGLVQPENLRCLRWTYQTPGSVVLEQVKQITTSDLRSKEIADEFNEAVDEIFDAVLNQIIKKGLIAFRNTEIGQGPVGEDIADALEDEAREIERTRERNNEVRDAIREADLTARAFLIVRRESVLTIDKIKGGTEFMAQFAKCEGYKNQLEAQNRKTFRQLNDEYNELQQFYLRQIGLISTILDDLKVYQDSLEGAGERIGLTEIIREFSQVSSELPRQGDVRSAERDLIDQKQFEIGLNGEKGAVEECRKIELLIQNTPPPGTTFSR